MPPSRLLFLQIPRKAGIEVKEVCLANHKATRHHTENCTNSLAPSVEIDIVPSKKKKKKIGHGEYVSFIMCRTKTMKKQSPSALRPK